jgi:hypothetical protein
MTEEEYNIRISKIRNKMDQLSKNNESYGLSFSGIDIEKELAILGEEIEDIKNELDVEDFLLSVDQLLIDEGYYNK